MATDWLILADDLTGACDSVAAFAARGLSTEVGWSSRRGGEGVLVFGHDGDSRGLSAAAAADLRRDQVAALLGPDADLLVKIDSTLRGQPAAEIAATLDASAKAGRSGFGVLAPAFPAMGRTTQDGRIRVDGLPLEETETWRREHTYPSADLVAVMASVGKRAVAVPLSTVREGQAALAGALSCVAESADLAICDAVCDDDLDRIVAAGLTMRARPVWIGVGGLAAALARTQTPGRIQPVKFAPRAGGVLTVVGSMAAASRLAAARLASEVAVEYLPVPAGALAVGASQDIGSQARHSLAAGRDVLVELIADGSGDPQGDGVLARRLAAQLGQAATATGGVVVTGGETAKALLEALGARGVHLVGTLEPGVTLGLTAGAFAIPLVTKAGAFGDEGVLVRANVRLRQAKREGTMA
jgi:uncharacterized protein YgbK (DUF1537 family)